MTNVLMWIKHLIIAFGPALVVGIVAGAFIERDPWVRGLKKMLGMLVFMIGGLLAFSWSIDAFRLESAYTLAADIYAHIGVMTMLVVTFIAFLASVIIGLFAGGWIYKQINNWLYRRKHQ